VDVWILLATVAGVIIAYLTLVKRGGPRQRWTEPDRRVTGLGKRATD